MNSATIHRIAFAAAIVAAAVFSPPAPDAGSADAADAQPAAAETPAESALVADSPAQPALAEDTRPQRISGVGELHLRAGGCCESKAARHDGAATRRT